MTALKTLLLAAVLLFAVTVGSQAQAVDSGGETPSPGTTNIDADELHMDQVAHTAVFKGNVMVTGTNFTMKCQEMTVNFDKMNKIDNIVAKGDVVIVQPGRITKSGLAVYHKDTDEFDLTDQPMINDNGRVISAPEIIINRTAQSLRTKGKSHVTIPEANGLLGNPTATPKQ